jgi:hypothetical protein
VGDHDWTDDRPSRAVRAVVDAMDADNAPAVRAALDELAQARSDVGEPGTHDVVALVEANIRAAKRRHRRIET